MAMGGLVPGRARPLPIRHHRRHGEVDVMKLDVLSVVCPKCHAQPGKHCVLSNSNGARAATHTGRVRKAKEANDRRR